ncbi:hypothetical protein TNCT_425751 [Trichonephila clavata]|uniref:Uncharacterized protein n=1 Tax=Trichonephila clavata TaxID=2740835 RepID=A0A8X6FSR0_TRICU|nr:hypothetical protein TNCT_425751 [Trichonephila clavata]
MGGKRNFSQSGKGSKSSEDSVTYRLVEVQVQEHGMRHGTHVLATLFIALRVQERTASRFHKCPSDKIYGYCSGKDRKRSVHRGFAPTRLGGKPSYRIVIEVDKKCMFDFVELCLFTVLTWFPICWRYSDLF